jgi:hypothetical protein
MAPLDCDPTNLDGRPGHSQEKIDMPVADPKVEVLIVGGGPVGLTARALLERWGVRTLLVEKYGALSPFPRSRLVNVRSMEIYRQLGLATKIAACAFAPEYGRIRFRDALHDRDFATAAMVGINAPIPESPVIGVVTSSRRWWSTSKATMLSASSTTLMSSTPNRTWALLQTYETERQPVAYETLRQAVANTQLMLEVQTRRRDQLQSSETAPAQIELPWSARYFAQLSLVLGVTYRSAAVLTDSTAPELADVGTNYVPTAMPGHRMPHLWLTRDRSTLDAFGEWFTLLTPAPNK